MVLNFDSLHEKFNNNYYFSGASAFSSASFGQGSGPIFLNMVACAGTESNLLECMSTQPAGCQHSDDAGVRCNQGKW